MLAIIAAIVFLIALLFQLTGSHADALNWQSLVIIGLILVALHMGGALGWGARYGGRRR